MAIPISVQLDEFSQQAGDPHPFCLYLCIPDAISRFDQFAECLVEHAVEARRNRFGPIWRQRQFERAMNQQSLEAGIDTAGRRREWLRA